LKIRGELEQRLVVPQEERSREAEGLVSATIPTVNEVAPIADHLRTKLAAAAKAGRASTTLTGQSANGKSQTAIARCLLASSGEARND
jgi:hypothetical protein